MNLVDLIELQILPASVDIDQLRAARARLRDAESNKKPYAELNKDQSLVGSIAAFVDQHGAKLAALFRLAMQVAWDGSLDGSLPLRKAFDAIARYVDLQSLFQQSSPTTSVLDQIIERPPDPTGPPLASSVDAVDAWVSDLMDLRTKLSPHSGLSAFPVVDAWSRWEERIVRFLRDGTFVIDPPHYGDIVLYAAGLAPALFFRRDLAQLTHSEWSELCLLAFPKSQSEGTPAWLFFVGLRVLGFGRQFLRLALAEFQDALNSTSSGGEWFSDLIGAGSLRGTKAGYVLVMRDDGHRSIATSPLQPMTVPILALPKKKLEMYDQAIKWLTEQGALAGTIHEEVE